MVGAEPSVLGRKSFWLMWLVSICRIMEGRPRGIILLLFLVLFVILFVLKVTEEEK